MLQEFALIPNTVPRISVLPSQRCIAYQQQCKQRKTVSQGKSQFITTSGSFISKNGITKTCASTYRGTMMLTWLCVRSLRGPVHHICSNFVNQTTSFRLISHPKLLLLRHYTGTNIALHRIDRQLRNIWCTKSPHQSAIFT